jgi:acetylglutamate kinase
MKKPYLVIKIGGNELAEPGFIEQLAATIRANQADFAPILVHGGGRAISDLMAKLNIQPTYKNGQRVTDAAVLEVAEMVLSGKINKDLVHALNNADCDAVGISGVDRKLLQVEPWGEDMHLVGRIIKVRVDVLDTYCKDNIVPVISPISVGVDGKYNVNADHAAGMIAGALNADQIVFISNVPGVVVTDCPALQLLDTQVNFLIKNNTIHSGMIPKVNAALVALKEGAKQTLITDLDGFINHTGTIIKMDWRKTHAAI